MEVVCCSGECSAGNPSFHVNATFTRTTYLKVVTDQVHHFIANIVLMDGLRNMKEFKEFTCPPNSPDHNPIEHTWDVLEQV